MKRPVLLVLTGTIKPPIGVPNLKRVDPAIRRQDYMSALSFYLGLSNDVVDRIVFLENSESDLSDLRELAAREGSGKQVEFISFSGLDYPPDYGRAYGEFKMLDYGMTQSELINNIGPGERFWKVTGRLKVLNLNRLIETSPKECELLIDFLRKPTPMVDLRLFSCSRNGYRRFFEGVYKTLREDRLKMSAEGYLYSLWIEGFREVGISPRHRFQPVISGVGGQHNVDYYSGVNVAKNFIRVIIRRFMPWVWI